MNYNNAGGTWDGKLWATALPTIQMGIDQAMRVVSSNKEVRVAVSLPAVAPYSEALTLQDGAALYGGFSGAETARSQRNPRINPTVIDRYGARTAVASSARGFLLDGFAIRDADYGVSVTAGDGAIANCTFALNPTIGVSVSDVTVTVSDCLFLNNGAGIFVSGASAIVTNCTVVGSASSGVYEAAKVWVSVANCIVAYNQTGFGCDLNSPQPRMWRNDLFANTTDYLRVFPRTGVDGNISADPLFADRATGNLRLLPGSPCIDAADDAVVLTGARDVGWQPRIAESHVDIGALEHNPGVLAGDDALNAIRNAGGLSVASAADLSPLNVEPGGPRIDVQDAVRIARKVAGLEPNP